jgi:hypothetical protein
METLSTTGFYKYADWATLHKTSRPQIKRADSLADASGLCYSSPPSKLLQQINKLRNIQRGLFLKQGKKRS